MQHKPSIEDRPPHSGSAVRLAEPNEVLSERVKRLEKWIGILALVGVIVTIGTVIDRTGIRARHEGS